MRSFGLSSDASGPCGSCGIRKCLRELYWRYLPYKDMFAEAAKKKEPVPKLAYYLQKQMDTMNAELMKRAAEQRIFGILQGSQEVFRLHIVFYRGK